MGRQVPRLLAFEPCQGYAPNDVTLEDQEEDNNGRKAYHPTC